MIFQPRGMVGVLIQVAVRDVVMLTADHAAKAAKIAFNPIRVLAVTVAVADAVIDPARLELGFKGVDARGRKVEQGPRPFLRPTISENGPAIVKGLTGG